MPSNHPLLRLPFPRGGYQYVFLQIVADLFLPSNKPIAIEKLLCYSVFKPLQQQKNYSVTLSLKISNQQAENLQQWFLPLERGG
jgi:hypothetical protein